MKNLLALIADRLTPERLKEPSTYAGLGTLGALFGLPTENMQSLYDLVALVVPADYAAHVTNIVMAVAGIVLVLIKKKQPEPDNVVDITHAGGGEGKGDGGYISFGALTLVLALSLILGACGAMGMNKQQYAGITHWQVSGNQTAAGEWQITDVTYTNGKEEDDSEIKISLNNGATILNFNGSGIKAFDGQALRAEVDKAVMAQFGKMMPELTESILKALKP